MAFAAARFKGQPPAAFAPTVGSSREAVEMSPDAPVFSCVVPTRGRNQLVRNLLRSLRAASKFSNIPIEILLIDDSDPSQRADILVAALDHSAVVLDAGSESVRVKRNLGIRRASGRYVFFVDSDCEVGEDIFLQHLRLYDGAMTGGVLGVTKFRGKGSFSSRVLSRTRFLDSFKFPIILRDRVKSAPWGPCTNLSFLRDVLIGVGGFDTDLPFRLGGDDVDLGMRVNKAGHTIAMSEHALVYHAEETWMGMITLARRIVRWGRMDYHLYYRKHTDLTFLSFPKPIAVFLLVCVYSLACGVAARSKGFFLIPFAWFSIFIVIFVSIELRRLEQLSRLFEELCAQCLEYLFQIGTLYESAKHLSVRFLLFEPIDDPRNIWSVRISESMAMVLSLVALLLWSSFM